MSNTKNENPFDIFSNVGTRHIKVKALNNAEVEIKKALTVSEEHAIKATAFAKQQTINNSVIPNQADLQLSKTFAVSYLLVNPKMTVTELGELSGAETAINEIYKSYEDYKAKKEGN